MLAALARAHERIDGQHRRVARQRAIDNRCPVIRKTGPAPDFAGDAFDGLLYRMEIIVREKFCAAVAQNIGMDATGFQIASKFLRPALRFWQGCRLLGLLKQAGLRHDKTCKGQRPVEIGAHWLEAMGLRA
ncbi:MAG TPA: hypothetical protein VMR39_13085 [Sphingobium sp.]|nr:hypothetical protein [Sphingobium sp.]HUD92511.1 hypothetical protein [Sphingobium sp.]